MKIYAYLRVSTGKQVEKGASLLDQQTECEKWAENKGAHLEGIFSDNGVSGGLELSKRPELRKAIAFLKKDDVLLVSKRDRLGRDVFNTMTIEKEIKRRKATLVSMAGEGSEDDGPSSDLTKGLIDTVSQYERAKICQRVRQAMQAKKSRNEFLGRTPFGHRLCSDGIHLEKDEAEQAALEQIKGLIKRRFSSRKLCAEMNRRKIFNRGGLQWSQSSSQRLMKKIKAEKNS